VLQLLEDEAAQVASTARRTALLEERSRLLQRTRGGKAALKEIERVRQLAPDAIAPAEIERAIQSVEGNWDAVVDAMLRAADEIDDARLEMGYRLVAAEILEQRLGRTDEAADTYVKALRLVPSHRTALTAAERLLVGRDRWHEVYDLMVRQGQALRDPAEVFGLYVRAGMIAAERLNDSTSAVKCFEAARQRRP